MTVNIVGKIGKSGDELVTGKLSVKLDAPLIDIATTPDTTHLPIVQTYVITGGVVDIDLLESQTSNVTYEFTLFREIETTLYYFASNSQSYFGDVHVYTDGLTYTGLTHTVNSELLTVGYSVTDEILDNFHAIVPNVLSVEFSTLRDTGITTDTLDTSQRRIAEILRNDQDFIDSVGTRNLGEYNPLTYYGYNDGVSYNGSSWVYYNKIPTAGNTPTEPSVYWQLAAKKGDPGGTGGIDTPYDATGWNGSLNAPSQNAVRDIIELLARKAAPVLTDPTANTQAVSDISLKLANTTFVDLRITERALSLILGSTASGVTQSPGDNSTKLVTTEFVKTQHIRYSKIQDVRSAGTNGGNNVSGINIRALNTIGGEGGDITGVTTNRFTVRAGKYKARARVPANSLLGNRLILWNFTDSIELVIGETNNTPAGTQNYAYLDDVFTIPVNKDCELWHYTEAGVVTNGLGLRTNMVGYSEVYASLTLERID